MRERPNPRLQRTRAALLLKSVLGERSSSGGDRRAPLSRQPLGGTEGLFRLKLVVTFLMGVLAIRCGAEPHDDSMHPLTELSPPHVVVIFRKGASNSEINRFLENAISTPDPRGGHAHRPGVGGIRLTNVGTHQGYVVSWTSTATSENRRDVRGRIDRDPIVCKVFENIEPSAINPADVTCP
jgi:hypothetical protein